MAQGLRALDALSEALGSIPGDSQTPETLVLGYPAPSSGPLGYQVQMQCTDIHGDKTLIHLN